VAGSDLRGLAPFAHETVSEKRPFPCHNHTIWQRQTGSLAIQGIDKTYYVLRSQRELRNTQYGKIAPDPQEPQKEQVRGTGNAKGYSSNYPVICPPAN
jgi:hypothetical protein